MLKCPGELAEWKCEYGFQRFVVSKELAVSWNFLMGDC
jgi:hypothetical protein